MRPREGQDPAQGHIVNRRKSQQWADVGLTVSQTAALTFLDPLLSGPELWAERSGYVRLGGKSEGVPVHRRKKTKKPNLI